MPHPVHVTNMPPSYRSWWPDCADCLLDYAIAAKWPDHLYKNERPSYKQEKEAGVEIRTGIVLVNGTSLCYGHAAKARLAARQPKPTPGVVPFPLPLDLFADPPNRKDT